MTLISRTPMVILLPSGLENNAQYLENQCGIYLPVVKSTIFIDDLNCCGMTVSLI